MMDKQYLEQEWPSRWVFFMAATATAVGLGNIWKFPFIVADNGGLLFVGLYVLCILLLAVPLMLSEVAIGYLGKGDPVSSVELVSHISLKTSRWRLIGFIGPLAGVLIIVLLTVVCSWAISYFLSMINGDFYDAGLSQLTAHFAKLRMGNQSQLYYQFALLCIVAAILSMHINNGLKRSLFYLVPMSIIMLAIMLTFTLNGDALDSTYLYLFEDVSQTLSLSSFLLALEHAFYTLSIGTGALLIFGAYMPKRSSLGIIVMSVALVDMAIALLAGFVVYPVLVAADIEPTTGFELMFIALPMAYGEIDNGAFLGGLFFLFVIFTALSSSMVLLEPSVAWCSKRLGMGRRSGAILVTFSVWLLSIACWEVWQLRLMDKMLFDVLNIASANVLLPLSALLIAIYSGWVLKPNLVRQQMAHSGVWALYLWYFLIRYIVPLALLTVILQRLILS